MPPLRVLYLTFGDAPGGAEMMLAQLLESLDKRVVEAHALVGSNGVVADMLKPHVTRVIVEPRLRHIVLHQRGAWRVLSNSMVYLGVLLSLSRRIRHDGFHLVHATATPAFKYGGLTARIAGVPSLATLYEVLDNQLISSWSRRLLAQNLNAFYGRVLVPSEAARRSAIHAGVTPDLLAVFENGIEVERFAPDPGTRRAVKLELCLNDASFVLGTVGRLIPLKGQDVAIRAVASISAQMPDVKLVIVGGARTDDERTWESRLKSLVAELGVADRVMFTGWRADMSRVYQALDCLVHTPVLPDASPVVLIEAMASGVPCIASDTGGVAEIIRHGETGLLVPPKSAATLRDALETIITDEELRSNLSKRGRTEVASRFDRRVRARELEAIYRQICFPSASTQMVG